jgi:hypothetical protein
MSSAKGIRAGGAYVEIFTENSRLVRGLRQAQTMLHGWGAGLRSFGAKLTAPLALAGVTGVAGLVALSGQIASYGDQIAKAADRTGMTTNAVSELGHAAGLSGSDFATLESGLVRMQRTTAEAAAGSRSAQRALAELGVSAADLAGMTPDQQLGVFADRIAAIRDPAARTNAAMEIFGKSGQKLIPMLSGGAAGLAAMREEAVALGKSIDRKDADAAAELGDSLDRLKGALKAATFHAGAAFAPALAKAFNWLAKSAGAVARWVRDNRGLILAAVAGAAAIAGVGVAIMGLGFALQIVSFALGGLIALWGAFGAALAFVVSPVGLVVAGLGGLAAYLLFFTDTGRQALSWFGEAWGVFRGEATDAWGAIVGALAAGDLQGAFEVAMAFLRLQWVRATNFLESKWLDFRDLFLDAWSAATKLLTDGFINANAAIEIAWVTTLDFLFDAWDAFTSRFMNGWRSAQNFVGKGFAWLIAKMEGLDPDEVMAEMDADLARRNTASSSNSAAAISARETARQQRLDQIEANRQGALGENAAMFAEQVAGRVAARGAAQSAEEEALATAQKNFAAALEKARSARGEDGGQPAAPQQSQFAAGTQRASQVAEAADIRSAEGLKQVLRAFGGGGPEAQTAQNTAHANKLLAEQNDKLDDQGETLDRIQRDGGGDTVSLAEARP